MKEHVTCRIDKEALKKANKIAQDENRSLSNFIETAVISLIIMKESLKTKRK